MNDGQGQNGKSASRLLATQTTAPAQARTPATRRSRPCLSEDTLPAGMTLMDLLHSPKMIPTLPDARAAKRVESLVSELKNFYGDASRKEKEIAFPAIARFIDNVCNLIYSTNDASLASSLMGSLNSLAIHEPEYVLNKLVLLSKNHKDEKIYSISFSCLESDFALMISTPERSSFRIMWEVLSLYENEPSQLMRISAQEFAKAASSFIFMHREYLMKNGYEGIVPYGVAWGVEISVKERIKFMEDVADGSDELLKTNLFSRVVLLSWVLPGGYATRFEAPLSASMGEKFPELASVMEDNNQLADMVESSERKRVQDAANTLLAYAGKQMMHPGIASLRLQ
jgi:hypothetical protein